MEIGVGIIGFGFMGRTHTHGLINLPLYYDNLPFRVKHISACRRDASGREEAERLGFFRKVTGDWREIVEDPEIDAVCISTPNACHKEQLLAAIAAGKHIYCDKPAVVSAAEAEEVLEALSGYRGKAQMVFHNRFFPATMRAKALVEAGFLGRIYGYRTAYLHASSIDPAKPLSWKSTQALGGGGSLVDLGSHALDMMQWLVGDVVEIFAATETFIGERMEAGSGMRKVVDTDDVAMMVVRHDGGAMGTVEATKFATGTCDELRFEIHGALGAMRFNLMDPNWLEVYDLRDAPEARGFRRLECLQQYPKPANGFPSPKASIGWIRAHLHCMYSFLESIALDRPASPSLEEGLRLQKVLAAGYRSAGERRMVAV